MLQFLPSAVLIWQLGKSQISSPKVLASHQFSLNNRYNNEFVNQVFKDNILLTLNYMENGSNDPKNINWSKVEEPFNYSFTLKPGQSFAFHNDVLPQYQPSVIKTTNSDFNAQEGFKSDGYLYGDGVCHLASLINWTAQDAKLQTLAPTNHNFANIPQVPKQFGAAIYDAPGKSLANEEQNVYITNNQPKDITFDFNYDGNNLSVSVEE